MPAGFSIVIKGVDNAAPVINRLNKSISGLRAPAQQFNKEFAKLKDSTVLKSVETGLNRVAQSGLGALQSISRVVEPLAAITSMASVAGLARLVTGWADYGHALNIASYQTGIAARDMQELQNAGRLAGVSAETVTGAYQGLGQAMYDAIGGRNGTALGMFKQLNIAFDDGTHHVANLRKAMEQLADQVAARNGDPMAQMQILSGTGVGAGMLPLLRQGSAGIRALEVQADVHGRLTDDDVERADKLWKSLTNAWEAAEGFGISMASFMGPRASGWIDGWTKDVDDLSQDLRGLAAAAADWHFIKDRETRSEMQFLKDREAKMSPDKRAEFERMRARRVGIAAVGTSLDQRRRAAGLPTSIGGERQAFALAYFKSQGWTPAQSAGIVANPVSESGLNPFAIGDGGSAYGIGQWHPDRQADYAKLFGHTMQSVTDTQRALQEQLQFYQHELAGGGDAGARKAGILLHGARGAKDAGAIVSQFDERPKAVDEAARNRGDLAELIASKDASRDGKVQVDTHIHITSDGAPTTVSRASGSGVATATPPTVRMPLVPAG